VALPPRIYCECTFVLHVVSVAKKYRAATMHPLGRSLQLLRLFVLEVSGSAISHLCECTFALNVSSVAKKYRAALMHPLGRWFCAVRCISGDGRWRCFDAPTSNTLGAACFMRVGGKWRCLLVSIVKVLLCCTLSQWRRSTVLLRCIHSEGAYSCSAHSCWT
jgi:hypothetical protein